MRSVSVRRSWLQSIAVSSVWWRGSAARPPPVSRANRSLNRSRICSTPRTRVRTAASSMARGRPSRRRQRSTTADWLAAESSNAPVAASARSRKRATASFSRSRLSGSVTCAGGSSRGGTGRTCSPGADSGSRLVARTRTPGAARVISATTWATASRRCSQLSNTSSSSLLSRKPSRSATGSVAAWSRRSSPASTALATSPGSRTSASSTSQAPAGKALLRSVAARSARRVLPTPPGPTRLTIRALASFLRSSASSRLRPTKLVASAGRLPRRRTGLAMDAAEGTTCAQNR